MKIFWPDFFSETNQRPVIQEIEKLGHSVVPMYDEECQILYCASIDRMKPIWQAKNQSPTTPLVVYCWDYYKWVHEGKSPVYRDWGLYRDLMYSADLVLVPSSGQKLRLQELLGISSQIVHTAVNVQKQKATDGRFVLDPVRDYPEENLGWVERACTELDIPYVHPEHRLSQEDFEAMVSSCSFMTCAYREASTGGLTLVEGMYNGKPILISDSPYMGGLDYVGEYAKTFRYDSYDDLKARIWDMWNHPETLNTIETRRYIKKHFAPKVMAQKILDLCEPLLN